MKLEALRERYGVAAALNGILDEIEHASGKHVDFRVQPDLQVRATTKIARRRMAAHLILFNPEETEHLSHLLAHECGHILRMMRLPPEQRKVPVSTRFTLAMARREIEDETDFLPPHLREQMLQMWINGLVLQVTNQPIDVRIERWLHDDYPELRGEQSRSLHAEESTIVAGLSVEVQQTTPPTIFRRFNAMNYAYLSRMAALVDDLDESPFAEHPEIVVLGEQLLEVLEDDEALDIALVNRCAEVLGIRAWFTWLDFEDMPESYYRV